MTTIRTTKFVVAFTAIALLLAACSSDSSDALPADTATIAVSSGDSSSTTTVEAASAQTPTTTEDTRTPEEAAIDSIDLLVAQLTGLETVAETSDCVIERLESEGVPLTGREGAPELAALIGCAPEAIDGIAQIDPAAASAETRTCLTGGLATWIGTLPLTEAQGFFESETPPDELITLLASVCSLSEEEVVTILG